MTAQLKVVGKDETAQTQGEPLRIPLSRISRYIGQPRRIFKDTIISLADSIQAEGQETPVKIIPDKAKSGYYELVSGERRWRAFGIIRDRTNTDPVVLGYLDLTIANEDDRFRKAFLENVHREDMHPLDEAEGFWRMRQQQYTWERICTLSGRSSTHVQQRIRLHTLPDEVKAMMDPNLPDDKQLSVSHAVNIAMSIPESDSRGRIELAQETVDRQWTLNQMKFALGDRASMHVASTQPQVARGTTYDSGYPKRARQPHDDYRMLEAFFPRLGLDALRFNRLEIDRLYASRQDGAGDRKRDAVVLETSIGHLQALLKKIKGEGG